MRLIPCLPPVKRFCFCTRNLKCASVTIIIVGMISSIHIVSLICAPQCGTLYNQESNVLLTLYVLMYLLFIFEMMLLASSFSFLLSIFFRSNSLSADFYICCALITTVCSVVYGIIQLIQGYYSHCGFQPEVLNIFVYFVMWIYFILIVNTYRDEI